MRNKMVLKWGVELYVLIIGRMILSFFTAEIGLVIIGRTINHIAGQWHGIKADAFRHQQSGIRHLSPVPEKSDTRLGPFIPVKDWVPLFRYPNRTGSSICVLYHSVQGWPDAGRKAYTVHPACPMDIVHTACYIKTPCASILLMVEKRQTSCTSILLVAERHPAGKKYLLVVLNLLCDVDKS